MSCEILIKSFMRHDVLLMTLQSLRKHFNGRIIVLDDSPELTTIIESQINQFNVELHKTEPNIGLSAGRNRMLKMVQSDYFLLMDNDFVLSDPDAITKLTLVSQHTNATIVGGLLWDCGALKARPWCGYFDYDPDHELVLKFYDREKIPKKQINGINYYECRFCQNFFLGRTEDFLRYNLSWDDNLKNQEHEDFFIRLPRKLKVVETPDIYVTHYPIKENATFDNYTGFPNMQEDPLYVQFRCDKIWRKLIKHKYNLSGSFFREYRNIYFDWTQYAFPKVNVKLL